MNVTPLLWNAKNPPVEQPFIPVPVQLLKSEFFSPPTPEEVIVGTCFDEEEAKTELVKVKIEDDFTSSDSNPPQKPTFPVTFYIENQSHAVKMKRCKRKFFLGDFDENDMYCPTEAKRVLAIAKFQDQANKKLIKNLRKKNTLLDIKIKSLKQLVKELKQRLKMNEKLSGNQSSNTCEYKADLLPVLPAIKTEIFEESE